ncbi:DgyrCDS13683 [Dimorphilus gyrociliatus]|uniref:DgyrCDS13683 n=1 Tax=Dimorphilus gyrociliatus TaxID=2664684 RepID=A0A7I8WBE4_9ANNE|nr:DgyrCDS13683 [Dimorphilus gyrociliatus]
METMSGKLNEQVNAKLEGTVRKEQMETLQERIERDVKKLKSEAKELKRKTQPLLPTAISQRKSAADDLHMRERAGPTEMLRPMGLYETSERPVFKGDITHFKAFMMDLKQLVDQFDVRDWGKLALLTAQCKIREDGGEITVEKIASIVKEDAKSIRNAKIHLSTKSTLRNVLDTAADITLVRTGALRQINEKQINIL